MRHACDHKTYIICIYNENNLVSQTEIEKENSAWYRKEYYYFYAYACIVMGDMLLLARCCRF